MALTTAKLNDVELAVDDIIEFGTSADPTMIDSITAEEKPTLNGVIADISAQATAQVEDRIGEVTTARDDATAAAASATASASQAATAATNALAAGHLYTSTAAALADGGLAVGAKFVVVLPGSLSAQLYSKDAGPVATYLNFDFPSAQAIQLSAKAIPPGLSHAWIDPNGLFGLKLSEQGVVEVSNLKIGNNINGQKPERFDEALRSGLAKLRSRGMGPRLRWDYNIILHTGQSESEGAQSVPPFSTTPVAGVLMMDAIRGRFFTGTRYASGFTPAVEVQDTDGLGNFWGETGLRTCGEMVQKLTLEECGSSFRSHQKAVVLLSIGHSSSAIADFSYGTPDFTLAQNTLAAMKAQATAEGRTIGIVGIINAWGANGYDVGAYGVGAAFWRSEYLRYHGEIDLYLGKNIFGQPIGSIPIGFWQTFAHAASTSNGNPYGAEVENQLCRDFSRYDIVNPEGPEFLENGSRHHSNHEAARMGVQSALWVHRRCIMQEEWPNYVSPVITRVDSNTLDVTYLEVPASHHLAVRETGVPLTRRMQPNFGFVLYDPASRAVGSGIPATIFAQSRQPKVEGNSVRLYATNPLPAVGGVGLKYSGDSIFGNIAVVPKDQLTELITTLTINGVVETVERRPGTFDLTGF